MSEINLTPTLKADMQARRVGIRKTTTGTVPSIYHSLALLITLVKSSTSGSITNDVI